ncbi:MAG: hypothetical protein IKR74_01250 [Bacilli bacterium]|nr:hypothetical protein [Bacilli bacterium]
MNVNEQITALCFNFIYGFTIYYAVIINYLFIKNEVLIVKLLITSLFLIDFTIIYLMIIYKLNYGMFHIYYLIAFVLGYILSLKIKKSVKLVKTKKLSIDIKNW